MKKLILICMGLFTATMLLAQSPSVINYQAVVRDATGAVKANQSVNFRISILRGSSSGTEVFRETHSTVTNEFGLVNLEIGNGVNISGNIGSIDWGASAYFVKIEMDPMGGTSYILMGTSRLLSVPYALHARTVQTGDNWGSQFALTDASISGNGTTSLPLKIAGQDATNGQVLKWNGTTWKPSEDQTGDLTLPYAGTSDALSAFRVLSSSTADYSYAVTGSSGASSNISTGVLGNSESNNGRGVLGTVYATNGPTIGVYGFSRSTEGKGILGQADATNGTTFGVFGQVTSPDGFSGYFTGGKFYAGGNVGIGIENPGAKLEVAGQVKITGGSPGAGKVLTSDVSGLASWQALPGGLILPYFGAVSSGESAFTVSNNGTGPGIQSTTAGLFGVHGISTSSSGYGVYGYTASLTGATCGIYGQSQSTIGRGVLGIATAVTGRNHGVTGVSASIEGTGVYGQAIATTGVTYGVLGTVQSNEGFSGFFTGGKVYMDANVGIGTGYPGAKLEVNGQVKITGGSPGAGKVLTSDASGLASWQIPSGGLTLPYMGTSSSSEAVFRVNNDGTGFAIVGSAESTTGANYGIGGQSNSTQGVGVYGVATTTSGQNYGVYGVTSSAIGRGVAGYASAPSGVNFGVRGFSASSAGIGVEGQGTSPTGVTIGVRGSVTSPNGYSGYFEMGRFFVGSNVGIGNPDPEFKLDVTGNRIRLKEGSEWIAMRTDGNTGFLDLSFSGGKLVIQGSAVNEDIIINPSMNKVGIRTWSPQYELDVNGSIRAIGSVYYGGSTDGANGTPYIKPDFVFEANYEKLDPENVEEFLFREKHLPWVTSAVQEKKENGLSTDMTRMAFETLESVENVQLQLIRQAKQIKELKNENDQLKERLSRLENRMAGDGKRWK